MTRNTGAPRIAVGLVTAGIALTGSAIALGLLLGELLLEDAIWALMWLPIAVVGGLIAARRPENPLGWIYSTMPLSIAIGLLVSALGGWAPALLGQTLVGTGIAGLAAFGFILFPTGRVPSRAWRWYPGIAIGFASLAVIGQAFGERIGLEISAVPNPLPLAGNPGIGLVASVGLAGTVLMALVGAASVIFRYRSAAETERQQLKWPASALALTGLFLAAATLGEALGVGGVAPAWAVMFTLMVGFPASIGVAVLRYRLYEVDRVISRTLGYGLLVAVLAGLYGLVVVGIPTVLPAIQGSQLLVAAATLAAFFLFSPLRKAVLRFVDRRFYRSRYDAERVVEAFSARLRDEVHVDQLIAEWVGVVHRTVQPTSISIWVKAPS